MPDDPRPFIPSDHSIVRIARSIADSTGGLWDFAQEYSVLNQQEGFNYSALARAVKDQHGVDLYPPSVATRLRKAYEKFGVECGVPISTLKRYSPYYLYELSLLADITPKNVGEWLTRATKTSRVDLVEEIKGNSSGEKKDPLVMLRLPENVYQSMLEAAQHVAMSTKQKVSNTVFVEFVSELLLNTPGVQVRRLWDAVHGDYPQESGEDDGVPE